MSLDKKRTWERSRRQAERNRMLLQLSLWLVLIFVVFLVIQVTRVNKAQACDSCDTLLAQVISMGPAHTHFDDIVGIAQKNCEKPNNRQLVYLCNRMKRECGL
jgi:hypothetical protein